MEGYSVLIVGVEGVLVVIEMIRRRSSGIHSTALAVCDLSITSIPRANVR